MIMYLGIWIVAILYNSNTSNKIGYRRGIWSQDPWWCLQIIHMFYPGAMMVLAYPPAVLSSSHDGLYSSFSSSMQTIGSLLAWIELFDILTRLLSSGPYNTCRRAPITSVTRFLHILRTNLSNSCGNDGDNIHADQIVTVRFVNIVMTFRICEKI